VSYDSVILNGMGTELWTLAELVERVAGALSSGYDGQVNRRVTEVPDIRAIRYYTTLGLLDRPAEMRGRTALYGPRHLWQLVAIKRLQADGRSLAEIQQELTAAPDAALRRLAAIPDEQFWRRPPAPPPEPASPVDAADDEAVVTAPTVPRRSLPGFGERRRLGVPPPGPGPVFQAVTLDGGAVVLIPIRETLTDREIAALRAAAGPLDAAVARLQKGLR
jgi:hypothetical protein